MKQLDVIIPVYRGLQETQECINSTVPTLPEWAQLIVINDASPEPELSTWLREQAASGAFVLLENEQNLGFVGTVNRGMALNLDRDVLLLNSDVEVPNSDWLTRMRTAAYAHDKVASLTPFSNNATVCSFPNFCADNELFAGLNVTELDAVFARLPVAHLPKAMPLVAVPTGVGFCMYMRRDCMNEVGLFDEPTFGKGYGEENDWCQRALKQGFVNYHQLNVFAYHKGGVSFQEEGDPRKAKAIELLLGLHPDYNEQVQRFIAEDPAKKSRLMAALAIRQQHPAPMILTVSHRLGGGVIQHLSELQDFYGNQAQFICLQPAADGTSVALSLTPNGQDALFFDGQDLTQQQALLALLRQLNVARVHVHHTLGVPDWVLTLAAQLGCDYDVTLHDYYVLNANPSLTDATGRFAGDANPARDALCAEAYPLPAAVSASMWRRQQLAWLLAAGRVIFPSRDVARRILSEFNDARLTARAVIAYHPDSEHAGWPAVQACQPAADKPLKVLVLGALSKEKGALLLEQVASQLEGEVEFHLLGYSFKALAGVITHGAYQAENLAAKLATIDADVVWFSAQCPETYSYTLSIALRQGLPVVYPNLGAFAERTQGRAHSYMLPWNLPVAQWCAFWQALASGQTVTDFLATEQVAPTYAALPAISERFYGKQYLAALPQTAPGLPAPGSEQPVPPALSDTMGWAASQVNSLRLAEITPPLTPRERMLLALWQVKHWPGVRGFLNLIPYRWQQKIKQRLSKKSIHEILPRK